MNVEERKFRREVRILDKVYWGKTVNMFFQVFLDREANSDRDRFKIMMRLTKSQDGKKVGETVVKLNTQELGLLYTYLIGGEIPENYKEKGTGALIFKHWIDTEEGKKVKKAIRFYLDDSEDKKGTLLISISDYTEVIVGKSKKPHVYHKRLLQEEIPQFKMLIGNTINLIDQFTMMINIFNKYFIYRVRDILNGGGYTGRNTPISAEESDDSEEEEEIPFDSDF